MQLTLGPLSLVALISALPAEPVARAGTRCGYTWYYDSAVDAASSVACSYVRRGRGTGNYPHQYKNYEHFQFPGTVPPYYEFPLLASGRIYVHGMAAGPDRVIIAYNHRTRFCQPAGQITHTGANGNHFVACSGTS
ncbi:ribonuclease domain-containing protein [Purpureocillium lilacinum]|uniref:ribonuclease T1 n=1 Tax=Purpureocillium lilacinum TaxID=33203 RepID=A0A179HQH0_PURLI|nr:ribonuclease domain-containing protein [Purpureocillium lilacinum]OAQ92102.1 ribonuclease domain-containing protein [Purpureocillium lilacinum]